MDEPQLLIYVTASWCSPCQQLSPFMESISPRGNIKIQKLDYDTDHKIVSRLRVRSVPTLLFYQDGELQHVCVSGDVDQVKQFLSRHSII
jgi:thioredoxin 1